MSEGIVSNDNMRTVVVVGFVVALMALAFNFFNFARINQTIALASNSNDNDDQLVTEVLQKMIKQRRESVDLYRKGNREELASAEEAEIAVIEHFLPKQMTDEEASAAIQTIIAETGAASMKDMGRVMAEVKARHATSIEPARASALVRAALA